MVAPEYTNDGTAQEIARYTSTAGGNWAVFDRGHASSVYIQDLYYETPVMGGTQVDGGTDYHGLGTIPALDWYYRHFSYEYEGERPLLFFCTEICSITYSNPQILYVHIFS